MPEGTTSQIVQLAADYSIRYLLRPYEGFTDDYQGETADQPIMFSEVADPAHSAGGVALDQLAIDGVEGYDPTLLRGLKVPLGARCLIWLPNIMVGDRVARYTWFLIWRMRNVRDYRLTENERMPYHVTKGVDGVDDGATPTDPERVVIPAAYETIWYSPAEPGTVDGRIIRGGRTADLSYASSQLNAPIVPGGGAGAYQQGILNPSVTVTAERPLWGTYETVCKGDEVLIGLTRTGAAWDFTDPTLDQTFALYFQSSGEPIYPDMGVYIFVGTGPAPASGPTA